LTMAGLLCFHGGRMSKQVLTRQRVLELIDQLQVGEAIPPERRLSSDLGISRLPSGALDDLVRDGYLERRTAAAPSSASPRSPSS
jgi:Transcriptional regulators